MAGISLSLNWQTLTLLPTVFDLGEVVEVAMTWVLDKGLAMRSPNHYLGLARSECRGFSSFALNEQCLAVFIRDARLGSF